MTPPKQAESERAAFEVWWLIEQRKTFPKHYSEDRLDDWGAGLKPYALAGWNARAAQAEASTAPTDHAALLRQCREVLKNLVEAVEDNERDSLIEISAHKLLAILDSLGEG